MLCCGYTLTDFPISIRLTSLALWQSNDCPSASKATLMNMDKHFMWIHYERLHNHNKAKHNKTVCIFLGIYCIKTCLRVRGVLLSLLDCSFFLLCPCLLQDSITGWCGFWQTQTQSFLWDLDQNYTHKNLCSDIRDMFQTVNMDTVFHSQENVTYRKVKLY